MAYVSHSGTNSSSQYDWKVLIFMVLLLASILVFVAAKFIYPEVMTTGTVAPAQTMSNTVTTSAAKTVVKKDAVLVVDTAGKQEQAPVSAPKVIKSVVDSAPVSSTTPIAVPAQKAITSSSQSDNLRCSDSDHAAGLCK